MTTVSNAINNQSNIYWNGTFKTNVERDEYRSTQFAKFSRPSLANTLCGDVQLAHDLFYRLSFKMPYAYQKAAYSSTASLLGTLAIPGIFLKTMKHLVLPGEEGAKVMLTRDFRDLAKALKSTFIGAALTVVRIAQAVTDPLLYIQWKLNSLKLRVEHRNDLDYQKYGQAAYLVIDLQRGFIPVNNRLERTADKGYGELAVNCLDESWAAHQDLTETSINNAIVLAKRAKDTTYVGASLDWHPTKDEIEGGHVSFASSHGKQAQIPPEAVTANGQSGQALFTDHCVEHTDGAKFVEGFPQERCDFIVKKGNHLKDDSFSAYGGNTKTETESSVYWTEQAALLNARGIQTVFISGLARDYCVNASAASSLMEAGINVIIVDDATAGVIETQGNLKQLKDGLETVAATVSNQSNWIGKRTAVTVEWKTTQQMLQMAPYFERSVAVV
jgi:nicotinamidase/pyrazinamidase